MRTRSLTLPFLLVSTLLTLSLGAWILTTALSMTIGKPQQTEDLLNKSGIYQAVIPQQVADAQKANPSLQNLPLDNPEVQKVLGQSLDSQKLQQQGNAAINALYSWLEGKSSKPHLDITVTPDQQALVKAAGDYAYQFASKLPACAPGEADYSAFAADPLSATCLPRGIDANTVRSNVENAVASNQIMPTQVTENDVKLWNGKTVMDSFTSAPQWFRWGQKLPLISAAVAILCMLLLLLILRPIRGIRSIGTHALSVGVVMAVVAIGLTWLFDKFYSSFFPASSNPNITSSLSRLSNLFDIAYRDNIVHLSTYLAIGGAIFLLAGIILGRLHRRAPTAATTSAASRSVASPSEPENLSAEPAQSTFTPSGPPELPKAPAVVKTAKPKATKRKTATKRPSTVHKKKK